MERFLTSDRLIAFHRNRLDVKTFPSDKLNIAYLKQKYQQYYIHLTSSSDELIIKTILTIYDELKDACEIYSYAIDNSPIIEVLFSHLKTHINTDIRVNSALCFKQLCKILPSKLTLEELGFIKDLTSIFDDKEPLVRLYFVEGLIEFVSFRAGQDSLLESRVFQTIINKIKEEKSELVLYKLLILSNMILKADTASQTALDCNFIQILKKHIEHDKAEIRINTFMNYASLGMSEHGKAACTNEGTLIKFCIDQLDISTCLLKVQDFSKVSKQNLILHLVQLTRFLLVVSILKRAKEEIYSFKGLEKGLNLLNLLANTIDSNFEDDIDQIIINTLQFIGNTSEDPNSRIEMLKHLTELDKFFSVGNPYIKKQVKLTVGIITWKP